MRALLVAAVCMVGCYSPHYGDCEVSCASNVCPSGLECREGMCRVGGASGACGLFTPDGGDDGAIPIDMLSERQLDAVCTYLARCGVFEDVATCRANLGATISSDSLIEAVMAGKVNYDGVKARECIDAMAANTCERARAFTHRDAPLACDGVFSGTISDNTACFIDEECVSRVCKISSCNMACCPGTCVGSTPPGRPALGQPCTQYDRCVDGYCGAAPNRVCTAFKTADAMCGSSEECMPGLSCLVTETDPAMRCRALTPTLGHCAMTAECADLADTCRGGACQTGGLTGTVCSKFDECQMQHPCSVTAGQGMCRLLPTVGESCDSYPVCRDGVCNAQGMCVAKVPNGGPCDAANGVLECESGYCDTSAGQCAAKPVCF